MGRGVGAGSTGRCDWGQGEDGRDSDCYNSPLSAPWLAASTHPHTQSRGKFSPDTPFVLDQASRSRHR